MSLFNLDRFRLDTKSGTTTNKQKDSGSKSPESEKENKPARKKSSKSSSKSQARGVVFDDFVIVSSDEEEKKEAKTKISSSKKSTTKKAGDEDGDSKVSRLKEIFPQVSTSQLLEVVESTSTFEGAVAVCMTQFASKDGGTKRKQDESSSSQESVQPSKKRKALLGSEEDDGEGGADGDEDEPSWEKQESMVRRLQRKFPDQDKEELRQVLKEHNWNVEDSLQVLQMFSDPENSSFSADETESKKPSKKKSSQTSGDSVVISDSDGGITADSEDENGSESDDCDQPVYHGNSSTLSAWISKGSAPASKTQTSSSQKPSTSSAPAPVSKSVSETGAARKQAAERIRNARASDEQIDSEGEEDDEEEDEAVSSEFESSDDDDLDAVAGMSDKKKEVFTFFQKAALDELCLITGCSTKKAQKILELRPFSDWETMVNSFDRQNGLTGNLLDGCKVFLKERNVVLGLMSKCEKISSLMVKQVTAVMDSGSGSIEQPSILNSELQLKPYQLIGLKWLLLLNEHKLSGILADEMGLGKTIQAIAFLAQLYENGCEGPHLVIVPASTLDNWVRELKLWCPSLKVLIYYGSMEERRYMKHDILSGEVEFNVIVTTYNLAIGNDSDRGLFRKLRLIYAVFDEGHMLKNMNSLRYRHLMAINAKYRLLLTGTPLQNNILELMSLLNFIMPSMFSDSTSQLSRMFSTKAQNESPFERARISQAKLIMKPFILRRVKSEVLKQLPAKEEKINFCSMSKKQQVLYENLFKKMKSSATGEKRELCNVMMQLRKMANHPLLHRQYYTTEKLKEMSKLMLKEPTHHDAEASLIQEDMEVLSDFDLHRLCRQYPSIGSYQLENKLLLDSGKFKYLSGLLASLKDEGSRVVLFSQFTMMLDIIEIFLKHHKHRFIRLDGSTPIADRIVLIDEYNTNEDIFVFLLSTRAGGLGINLTSANVVILHDIDCNPYNDKQAEDRCHRVGQTRTVRIMKLISKGTIEDAMLQIGQRKLKLEQDMTAAEEGEEGSIPEDIASLLKASLGL